MTKEWIEKQLLAICKDHGCSEHQASGIVAPLVSKWSMSTIKGRGTDSIFKEAVKRAKKIGNKK